MTCSTKLRLKKATAITDMYAAFDLGQRTIRAVLKRQDGKIVNELKIKRKGIGYCFFGFISAASDPEFRNQLIRQPSNVLAQYNISDETKSIIENSIAVLL